MVLDDRRHDAADDAPSGLTLSSYDTRTPKWQSSCPACLRWLRIGVGTIRRRGLRLRPRSTRGGGSGSLGERTVLAPNRGCSHCGRHLSIHSSQVLLPGQVSITLRLHHQSLAWHSSGGRGISARNETRTVLRGLLLVSDAHVVCD